MAYHFQLTPRLLVIGAGSLLALLLLLFLMGLEIGRQMASPAPIVTVPDRVSEASSAASTNNTLQSKLPDSLPPQLRAQLPTQQPAQLTVQRPTAPEATAVTQPAPHLR